VGMDVGPVGTHGTHIHAHVAIVFFQSL